MPFRSIFGCKKGRGEFYSKSRGGGWTNFLVASPPNSLSLWPIHSPLNPKYARRSLYFAHNTWSWTSNKILEKNLPNKHCTNPRMEPFQFLCKKLRRRLLLLAASWCSISCGRRPIRGIATVSGTATLATFLWSITTTTYFYFRIVHSLERLLYEKK